MEQNFVEMLEVGGKSNSLGRVYEVIGLVLEDKPRLDELYDCLFVSYAIILDMQQSTEISLHNMKAAIFDMDGTMIANMAHHKRAWQEFLRRHEIELTDKEFREKISGKKNDQIFELVFGRKLDKIEELEYTEEKESIYRELYAPDIEEIQGLGAMVDSLHWRGIKTVIATTAPAKNREFALKALGLEGKFEVILGDEHVIHGKPDPEIFLATAKQLGVEPAECIVFEDSPPGVQAGKRAGMTVIGILSSHAAADLHEADFVVEDFNQIKMVSA